MELEAEVSVDSCIWTSEDVEAINGLRTLVWNAANLDGCEVLLACLILCCVSTLWSIPTNSITRDHHEDVNRFRGICTSLHLKQLGAMQPAAVVCWLLQLETWQNRWGPFYPPVLCVWKVESTIDKICIFQLDGSNIQPRSIIPTGTVWWMYINV